MQRLIPAILLAGALTACGGGGNAASDDPSPANDPQNVTGLPAYPDTIDVVTLPSMQRDDVSYTMYGAKSDDALEDVEGWYREHLGKPSEKPMDDVFSHGIEFSTAAGDLVDVYNDKTGDAKYVTIKLLKKLPGT